LLLLGLAYVQEPVAALAEGARILNESGRLVVIDLLRHDRETFRVQTGQLRLGFEPEELEGLMGEAGLACDHCAPLPPEPGAKGPALLMAAGRRREPATAAAGKTRAERAIHKEKRR
jgi:hypothetical protein